MDILFDRQSRDDRMTAEPTQPEAVEHSHPHHDEAGAHLAAHTQPASEVGRDLIEQVHYLTDEVEHLRACIDQLLDLIDAQSAVADDVDLLFDWTRLADRRIQRIEDSAGGRPAPPRRRAEDAA